MPPPSYEDHAAIYAATLIFCLHLLAGTLAGVGGQVAPPCRLGFATVLAGLMILPKGPTLTKIAAAFGLQSHDTLRRALLDETWQPKTLMTVLVQGLSPLFSVWLGLGPGYLILDDVLLPKPFSRVMEAAYYLHDYVRGRKSWCLCLVVLVWSNGVVTVPLAFALWHQEGSPYLTQQHQEYHTKRALAQELIQRVLDAKVPFAYVTFDSWYAARSFLKWLHREKGLRFVTALCCTTKVRWLIAPADRTHWNPAGRPPCYVTEACQHLVPRIGLPYFSPYAGLRVRAKAGPVNLRSVSVPAQADMTLVIIPNYRKERKEWAQKEPQQFRHRHKYLLTNIPDWNVRQIIAGYQSRWDIEVFFRNMKQFLGLEAGQARGVAPMERHLTLCLVGYTMLALLREELRPGWDTRHEPLTIGAVKRYLQQQAVTVTAEGKVSLHPRPALPRATVEAMGEAAAHATLTDLLSGQFTCQLPPEALA